MIQPRDHGKNALEPGSDKRLAQMASAFGVPAKLMQSSDLTSYALAKQRDLEFKRRIGG